MLVKLLFPLLCWTSIHINIEALEESNTPSDLDGTERFIQVKTLSRRTKSQREARLVAFEINGTEFHFNLKPLNRDVYSPNIPVYLVKSEPKRSPNYTYELVKNTEDALSSGRFYVDNARKAVFFSHYDEKSGEILYDGLFGESKNEHVIRSLKESQRTKLQYDGNHLVYKVTKPHENYSSIIQFRSDQNVNPLETKLEKPLEILYPKILAVVDFHLYRTLGNSIANTIKYVSTLFIAVDQKYMELDTPKVQVILTGIIIANDETALNFVNQSKGTGDYADYLDVVKALLNMRLYFHHNFTNDNDFQNYDAAILLTGQKTMVGGLTHSGKICGVWYNDAVVTDDGSYKGVHIAIHELAHMMTANHDTSRDDPECPSQTNDGGSSVMIPSNLGSDYIYWSKCTKNSIKEFASLQASECLRKSSRERKYDKDEWF